MITIPASKAEQFIDWLSDPHLLHLTVVEMPYSLKVVKTLRTGQVDIYSISKE